MTAIAATRDMGVGTAWPASPRIRSITNWIFRVAIVVGFHLPAHLAQSRRSAGSGGMFRRRRIRVGGAWPALALIGLTCTPNALSAAEPTTVSVEIENRMTTSALRCQLVLAHFVTVALDPIPSGQTMALELLQEPEDRTLLYKRDDGPSMAVENILCGLDDDWAATRENVNLAVLRARGVPAMRIVCAGFGPKLCRTP